MEEVKFVKDKYEFTSASPIMLMNSNDEGYRAEQINLLLHDFTVYGVLLRDLINYPIKERERNVALNIACYIMDNEEIHQNMLEHRYLNINKMAKVTKIKSEYIKKWKDYIIAYWIILSNPDYKFIQNYFKIKLKENLNKEIDVSQKKEKSYRGIVVRLLLHNTVYILTSTGEFKKVKPDSHMAVGSICEGRRERNKYLYKLPISIFLFIAIIIGFNMYSKYKTTSSIIVIETTSNIKLHINDYDRVIYAYSPTDKGKSLILNTNIQNRKVDDVLCEIMEYGYKNRMISLENKVYITVTGKGLEYGELVKTSNYADDNKISVVINNVGVEQKLLKKEKVQKTEGKDKK